jgi:superfamily II DNA or RNA helicase
MIQLRDYQLSLIHRIRESIAAGNRCIVCVAPTGAGKCLAPGTPILMHDGSVRPVEAVNDNDMVMGPDSLPRRVTSTCTGQEMMYRITPTKGEPYTVNESHVLSLRITGIKPGERTRAGNGKYYGAGDTCNLTVAEYLASSKTFKHVAKGWRAAVDFPAQTEHLPIPPRILGIWLGDGNSDGASICNVDPEVVADWADYGDSLAGMSCKVGDLGDGRARQYRITMDDRSQCGRGHHPSIVLNALRQIGVIGNKHIPAFYKTASRVDRLQLLAGIIDTDGHLTNGGYDAVFKQRALADDIAFVARSLGLAAYVSPCRKTATNTGATGDYWRISISGECSIIPCRVPRRICPPRKQKKSVLMTGIHVEPVGHGTYHGFTLDGPDRLFLLGDFTVTHNTTIFSHITSGASTKGRKVLILAHRQELVAQGADTMARFGIRHEAIAPSAIRSNIAVSHLKKYGSALIDPTSDVRVASVQTLIGRMDRMPWVPDIIIIDEGHHCTEGSTWGKVLAYYTERNPKLLALMFTATPIRLDGKGLGEGAGGYADHMVIGPSIGELVKRGFLCKPIIYAPPNALDLVGIRTRFGDYAKGELEDALDKPAITGDAVAHYKRICGGEPAVAFCAGIAHAAHVAEEFCRAGYRAVALDGKATDAHRRETLAGLGNGTVDVVCSADLIGEGVDIPAVRAAILLRPTMSVSLYIQQTGRALRTVYAPGMPLDTDEQRLAAIAASNKPNAIILDHVGNSITHGLIDEDRTELWTLDGITKKRGKAANDNVAAPVTTCPQCYAVHAPTPTCPACGHIYVVKPRQPETVDGDLVAITDDIAERMKEQKRLQQRKEVGGAQSLEQLRQIEKQRAYKPGWADHVFAARQKRRA